MSSPARNVRYRPVQSSVLGGILGRLSSRTYLVLAVGTAVLVLAAVGIVRISSAPSAGAKEREPPDPRVPLPPSPSVLRAFKAGAVCSDGPPCSTVGSDILRLNGSAVDAAIATLLCNGIVNCHSMGLGGGFLMTVYDRNAGTAHFLNARESAPAALAPEAFGDDGESARRGPLATGVPGELAGYWAAHRRFGRLPWATLVEPSVRICREGYLMSRHQQQALGVAAEYVRRDETLRAVFLDPAGGGFRREGDRIVNGKICDTLEAVARGGADEFYLGRLGKTFAEDVRRLGGVLSEEDLASYRVRWSEPIRMPLAGGHAMFTAPPPGGGVILALVLNVLAGYNFSRESVATLDGTVLTYHRIAEAFKHAFAKRTELGDPSFVDVHQLVTNATSEAFGDAVRRRIDDHFTRNDADYYGANYFGGEDHGTAHVSVVSPEGDAVSVTSTINLYFGAGVVSNRTGIILNSGMDDFSSARFQNFFGLLGSHANRLQPGKQPLSSMSPTIVVDAEGNVRLVIGAAGGTKIPTAIAYVMLRHLWLGDDIKAAVDSSRIHHQLHPMTLFYEYGVLEQVVAGLKRLGHRVSRYRNSISVVCAIARVNGTILANADYRKKGDVRGF